MTPTDPRVRLVASSGTARAGLTALGGAVLVVAVLLRQDGMPAYDVMWAEDGRDFIGDAARAQGTTVLRQYAGYLHLLPRVVAELVVSLLPVTTWAAGMAVAAASTGALLAVAVFYWLETVRAPLLARVAAAGATALPAIGPEGYANMANVQWLMAAGTGISLLLPSPERFRASRTAVAAAAAVTSPVGALLAGIVLVRRHLSDRHLPTTMVIGFAIALQLGVVLTAQVVGEAEAGTTWSWAWLLRAPAYWVGRIWTGLVVGEQWTRHYWYVGPLTLLGAVGYVWSQRNEVRFRILASGVAISLAVLAVVMAVRTPLYSPQIGPRVAMGAGRYVVAPFIILAVTAMASTRRRIAAVWVLVVVVTSFPLSQRSEGPSWSAAVSRADAECDATGVGAVEITTAPVRSSGHPWTVTLPCDELRSGTTDDRPTTVRRPTAGRGNGPA